MTCEFEDCTAHNKPQLTEAEKRWRERPLLCKLGQHRHYKRIDTYFESWKRYCCLLCGHEWRGEIKASYIGSWQ